MRGVEKAMDRSKRYKFIVIIFFLIVLLLFFLFFRQIKEPGSVYSKEYTEENNQEGSLPEVIHDNKPVEETYTESPIGGEKENGSEEAPKKEEFSSDERKPSEISTDSDTKEKQSDQSEHENASDISCSHDFQPIMTTIVIPEEYHIEKDALLEPAWDEEVYSENMKCICQECGEWFENSDEWLTHAVGSHGGGSYRVDVVLLNVIHHDAVYGDRKIVDREENTQELTHWECSKCGMILNEDPNLQN